MENQDLSGWITRVDRVWILPQFKKVLEKRQRESTLLDQLDVCVRRLFQNPCQPGLNLETLFTHPCPVLSARIDRSYRLILVPLGKTEVGLLTFDNHQVPSDGHNRL